ncbi:nucleotidyltransferase family protein [Salicibibacter cibarius]|uniref:Nucleotidyltransferase family protein n=1 Tax=Salicibibacter cibarius TaxID=2743000 RepID=A0A7T6Z132_9BACI|nr:nucleotidyltransferase family protein [Salicibibacter cibarius]QQK75001.1 nucleotidyltransferase family protein [Salicibibacter cibarius]
MKLHSEADIIDVIERDRWMMEVLQAVKDLQLPDGWICSGFVRAKIWDTLHDFHKRTPLPDVDVIYFDAGNIDESEEKKREEQLKNVLPLVPWSVKNQARMHLVNGGPPYTSSVDAISKFPETATTLGVRLGVDGRVTLTAPCGVEDVLQGTVRPTPFFRETEERLAVYKERVVKKNWSATWGELDIRNTYNDRA